MLDYFDSNPDVFYTLWFIILGIVLVVLYLGGRKAEKKFRGLERMTVKFREKGASGRSHKSLATKIGGASRVLDVIVTDRELWIKGILPPFTYIGAKYDLSHRVPLERIGSVRLEGSNVFVSIRSEVGTETDIELQLRNPVEFVRAIGA